jgi:hypothetical protein
MCKLCDAKQSTWHGRRGFLLTAGAFVAAPVLAQVDVGQSSRLRSLVPANDLELAAAQQYGQLLEQARAKHALAPESHPQLQRLRKIAFYTGILERLKLTDAEIAMVMGHEMAHALREHARERIAKSQGTGALLSLGAQLFGLGQIGDLAANVGTQLLTLKFSRDDEVEADLVGLELGARAGYNPEAAISLWQKMEKASGSGGPGFLSTHPSGPERIHRLQENVPRVRGLYQQAIAKR